LENISRNWTFRTKARLTSRRTSFARNVKVSACIFQLAVSLSQSAVLRTKNRLKSPKVIALKRLTCPYCRTLLVQYTNHIFQFRTHLSIPRLYGRTKKCLYLRMAEQVAITLRPSLRHTGALLLKVFVCACVALIPGGFDQLKLI
jgi:hypothetical protein